MPWRVEYLEDQKIVDLTYWGDASASDVHDATLEAIACVKENDATLVLVDCREQTSTASVPELSELPVLFDGAGLPRTIKPAFVEPKKKEMKDVALFFELVLVNRGWQLHRFTTRDSAIDWLLSESQ